MTDEEYKAYRIASAIEEQREGYRCLGRLLARAAKAGIPVIEWKVAWSGVVIGTVRPESTWQSPEAEARAAEAAQALFDRWVEHLGGTVRVDYDHPYRYGSGGRSHMVSISDAPGRVCGVGLRISLEIPPPEKN